MNASSPVYHDPRLRLDVVNRLTDHLLQYPQDLIDATRLIKNFQASAHEFQQALHSIDSRSPSLKSHSHRG
jgi:hypothetical protein